MKRKKLLGVFRQIRADVRRTWADWTHWVPRAVAALAILVVFLPLAHGPLVIRLYYESMVLAEAAVVLVLTGRAGHRLAPYVSIAAMLACLGLLFAGDTPPNHATDLLWPVLGYVAAVLRPRDVANTVLYIILGLSLVLTTRLTPMEAAIAGFAIVMLYFGVRATRLLAESRRGEQGWKRLGALGWRLAVLDAESTLRCTNDGASLADDIRRIAKTCVPGASCHVGDVSSCSAQERSLLLALLRLVCATLARMEEQPDRVAVRVDAGCLCVQVGYGRGHPDPARLADAFLWLSAWEGSVALEQEDASCAIVRVPLCEPDALK
ncbi:hypothetical protein [Alicyclobacillus vulcanalis]|nr:hypothetical protein [Alicyclobacillus vulcanalis]